MELVGVLELGGDHEHDGLRTGWDLDEAGLDGELDRTLMHLAAFQARAVTFHRV